MSHVEESGGYIAHKIPDTSYNGGIVAGSHPPSNSHWICIRPSDVFRSQIEKESRPSSATRSAPNEASLVSAVSAAPSGGLK